MSKIDNIPPSYIAGQVAKMNGRKLSEEEKIEYSYADRIHREVGTNMGLFSLISMFINMVLFKPVSWAISWIIGKKIRNPIVNSQMNIILDDYESKTGKIIENRENYYIN